METWHWQKQSMKRLNETQLSFLHQWWQVRLPWNVMWSIRGHTGPCFLAGPCACDLINCLQNVRSHWFWFPPSSASLRLPSDGTLKTLPFSDSHYYLHFSCSLCFLHFSSQLVFASRVSKLTNSFVPFTPFPHLVFQPSCLSASLLPSISSLKKCHYRDKTMRKVRMYLIPHPMQASPWLPSSRCPWVHIWFSP